MSEIINWSSANNSVLKINCLKYLLVFSKPILHFQINHNIFSNKLYLLHSINKQTQYIVSSGNPQRCTLRIALFLCLLNVWITNEGNKHQYRLLIHLVLPPHIKLYKFCHFFKIRIFTVHTKCCVPHQAAKFLISASWLVFT